MGSIYKRGDRYYIRFKDPDGKWVSRSASDNLAEAKKVLREVEKGVKLLPVSPAPQPVDPGSVPMRELVPAWIQRRRERGIRSWQSDERSMQNRIFPVLGDMPLKDIRVKHVRDFVDGLVAQKLASRSVKRQYGLIRKFFADMRVEEIVTVSPCVLTKDQLPKDRDRDPEWRAGAVFAREEVELILGTPMLPEDRRFFYALLLLTGIRLGEAIGLRWRDLDLRAEPLGRMQIARSFDHATKTERPRQIPIHPMLAAYLEDWRTGGYYRLTGKQPEPDALVVPSRRGGMRTPGTDWQRWERDLDRLGLRHRRVHDTRRTFITLARADGARKDVLEQVTHGHRGSIIDIYTTLPWSTLCEAVSCLKLGYVPPSEFDAFERGLMRRGLVKKRETEKKPESEADGSTLEAGQKAPTAESGSTESSESLATIDHSARMPMRRRRRLVTRRVTRKHPRGVEMHNAWKLHVISKTGEEPLRDSKIFAPSEDFGEE